MSKLADELCAEIRNQCEQAEHFKRLWMQANAELEKAQEALKAVDDGIIFGCQDEHGHWHAVKHDAIQQVWHVLQRYQGGKL